MALTGVTVFLRVAVPVAEESTGMRCLDQQINRSNSIDLSVLCAAFRAVLSALCYWLPLICWGKELFHAPSPPLGYPHAVVLLFVRCDQLAATHPQEYPHGGTQKQCARATKSLGRIERNNLNRSFRLLPEKKLLEMIRV